LTPPFGFALFYLRGVAPKSVTTLQIYKGAAGFIVLQLVGLAIAGAFPSLVNYLPNKTHLVSETAPPPSNPKLQECLESYLFSEYDARQSELQQSIDRIQTSDLSFLPDEYQERLNESYGLAANTFDLVDAVRVAERNLDEYSPAYRPLHLQVRQIQKSMRKLGQRIELLDDSRQRLTFSDVVDQQRIDAILANMDRLKVEQEALESSIPGNWKDARAEFNTLAKAEKMARLKYRQNVDDSYTVVLTVQKMINQTDSLAALQTQVEPLIERVRQQDVEQSLDAVKSFESEIDQLAETHRITSKLSRAKRALRGDNPDSEQAIANIRLAAEILQAELQWRQRADSLAQDLRDYDQMIASTLGMRMQQRLSSDQAESIASCLAVHRDLSLHF
jgi:hypothetical protein